MPLMPFRRLALIAAFAGLGGPAIAQQAFVTEPANLPPESFTGDQFVDNNGCIFVRAGFNGTTTWVPRVTRSREPICGQEPTFETTATADAAQPDAAGEPTAEAPAPTPVARQEPAAEVAQTTPERPRTTRPQASVPPRIVRSVPQRVDVAAPKGARLPDLTPRRVTTAPVIVPRVGAKTGSISSRDWIVPKHVYENRVERGVTVPPGYEPAWDDDRLNPWRAWQKIEGYRATQRVWTDTVPRVRISPEAAARVEDPTVAYRASGPAPGLRALRRDDPVRYVPAAGRRW